MLTKDTLFRPSRAESKAESTATVAKGIIDAETATRQAKSAKLRAARIERDASEAAQKPAIAEAKPRKRSSVKAKPANRAAQA